jgi:hypothetical protein
MVLGPAEGQGLVDECKEISIAVTLPLTRGRPEPIAGSGVLAARQLNPRFSFLCFRHRSPLAV